MAEPAPTQSRRSEHSQWHPGGAVAGWLRFTRGLGATTQLSDDFPWGLWIGFDVLCGVGLAAGGFTIAAVVHVFNVRRFEPIVRPAILTAFLGTCSSSWRCCLTWGGHSGSGIRW